VKERILTEYESDLERGKKKKRGCGLRRQKKKSGDSLCRWKKRQSLNCGGKKGGAGNATRLPFSDASTGEGSWKPMNSSLREKVLKPKMGGGRVSGYWSGAGEMTGKLGLTGQIAAKKAALTSHVVGGGRERGDHYLQGGKWVMRAFF